MIIKRSKLHGVVLAAVLAVFGGLPSTAAWGQNRPQANANASARVVSLGKLVRAGQSRNGTPRFALTDPQGSVVAYVVPPAGMNLGRYVNQEVAVTARQSRNRAGGIPQLLAERVTGMSERPTTAGRPASGKPGSRDLGRAEVETLGEGPSSGDALGASRAVAEDLPRVVRGEGDRDPVIDVGLPDYAVGNSIRTNPQGGDWGSPQGRDRVRRAAAEETLPTPVASEGESYGNEPIAMEGAPVHDGMVHDEVVQGGPVYGGPVHGGPAYGGPVHGGIIHEGVVGPGGCATGDCGLSGCSTCGDVVPTADCVGGACGTNCCPCGPSGRFWLRGEYMMLWASGMNTPPLVSTSSAGTPAGNAGVLGLESTEVLYGGEPILTSMQSASRFSLGMWLDACQWRGIEFDYFVMSEATDSYGVSSTGEPILARPFFNVQNNSQDSELVAYPGIVTGGVNVSARSELYSLTPRMRLNLKCQDFDFASACGIYMPGCNTPSGGQRIDFTIGYRYMVLDEGLTISEQLSSTSKGSLTSFGLADDFDTENRFNGGEVGLVWDCFHGRWSMEMLGRFALGTSKRSVSINGSTSTTTAGQTTNEQGGLMALSSNIGDYEDSQFAVIPEFGVNLGYQIAPSLRFLVGYSILVWGDVVRPGDQIDPRINPNLLPPALAAAGPVLPEFRMNEDDYWIHGVNLGLDWRW